VPLAIPAARIIHCRILTWTELGTCLEIEYDFDHATRHDRLVHGYMVLVSNVIGGASLPPRD
jgi:hypothetical protein